MEFLIKDLIRKLNERKKTEYARIEKHTQEKEIVFISSGKIFEIDHIIKDLEEMLKYYYNKH
jgi:hypothetical protein